MLEAPHRIAHGLANLYDKRIAIAPFNDALGVLTRSGDLDKIHGGGVKGMKIILKWVGGLFVSFIMFSATTSLAESLTGPQKNAVRSAKLYLSIQGFSRAGLIHQISSDFIRLWRWLRG